MTARLYVYSLCPSIIAVVALNKVHHLLSELGRVHTPMLALSTEPGRFEPAPERHKLWDRGSMCVKKERLLFWRYDLVVICFLDE